MRERRKRALWTESICSLKKKELPLLTLVTSLSLQSTPWQLAHTLDPLQGGWPKLGFHPSPGRCQQCQGCQVEICSKELHFRPLVTCWLFSYKKGLCCAPLQNKIILNILSKIYVSLCWKMLENCDPIIWPPASPPAIVLALFCCFNEYRFSLFKENGKKTSSGFAVQ